jgi:hypothetical protein
MGIFGFRERRRESVLLIEGKGSELKDGLFVGVIVWWFDFGS